jgi:hypothetical protein
LDSLGYYSDFIPVAKWVGRFPWSWEWDFRTYIRDLEQLVNLEIRYYYNRPDAMTWDDGLWHLGLSTVGRRESLFWQKDIDKNRSEYGISTPIYHFVCTTNDVEDCGPSHKQRDAMWDFTNPSMEGTGRPVRWQFARMGAMGQNLGLIDEESLSNEVLVTAEPNQLPHTICLRETSDLCSERTERYAPEDELEQFLSLPNIICGNEEAGATQCQTTEMR